MFRRAMTLNTRTGPWSRPAPARRSRAALGADAAGGRMLRARRLAVLVCTVLRAARLPPLPAAPQEPVKIGSAGKALDGQAEAFLEPDPGFPAQQSPGPFDVGPRG